MIEATRSGSTITHRPIGAGDPRRRRPDITLARERLNRSPQVALEEGIAQAIAYFRPRVLGSEG